ncbi:MAG: hypothetical protein V3R32_01115, partial [Nitrosomonadaceae bacterium]
VGYGVTPTYLNSAGNYIGDYTVISATSDLGLAWSDDAYGVAVPRTAANGSNSMITLSKINDGDDTWSIASNFTYDNGASEFLGHSIGRVNGAALPAALSALKFTLTAGNYTSGLLSVNVYCNEDV